MGIMTKICENIGIRVNLEIYGEKTNSKSWMINYLKNAA
jgi:hypothetical protein